MDVTRTAQKFKSYAQVLSDAIASYENGKFTRSLWQGFNSAMRSGRVHDYDRYYDWFPNLIKTNVSKWMNEFKTRGENINAHTRFASLQKRILTDHSNAVLAAQKLFHALDVCTVSNCKLERKDFEDAAFEIARCAKTISIAIGLIEKERLHPNSIDESTLSTEFEGGLSVTRERFQRTDDFKPSRITSTVHGPNETVVSNLQRRALRDINPTLLANQMSDLQKMAERTNWEHVLAAASSHEKREIAGIVQTLVRTLNDKLNEIHSS
jgi:hypothetical protein